MVLQLLLFGENNMGLRYSTQEHSLEKQWRKVALNVLRRLRQDCLKESKFANDSTYSNSERGIVYIDNSTHLQYWCDVAEVSKEGYTRKLKRDIDELRKTT